MNNYTLLKKMTVPWSRFHGGRRRASLTPHTWPREIATSLWGLRCAIRGLLITSQALAVVAQPVPRPLLAQWGTDVSMVVPTIKLVAPWGAPEALVLQA